jgi:probable F420-dependent oxidoreductase
MTITTAMLGQVGVWARELRFDPDPAAITDAAAELDELGYGTLWIPDVGGDVFDAVDLLLDAAPSAAIATGILNIWMHDAAAVARETVRRWERHPNRFVLGLGASHAALVEQYAKPWTSMRDYLDALDAASPGVPAGGRLIAALGPRMMRLAAERTAGAHPYFITVEHTRQAREILGPDGVLAPELPVVLDGPDAQERARAHVADYLRLPNYARNLLRLGFTEDDLRDGGSDRLVHAVVAIGDEEAIATRVAEHLDAGADHVCIQSFLPSGERGFDPRVLETFAPARQ